LRAGLSTTAAAQNFWESASTADCKSRLSTTLLHRPADSGGRAVWAHALMAGLSEAQVTEAIVTSPEYLTAHPSADGFITALYQDALSRQPDANGLRHWEGVFQMPNGAGLVAQGLVPRGGASAHCGPRLRDCSCTGLAICPADKIG